MGLFDRFRRKPPRTPQTAEELFAALAEAVANEDGERFAALCREHTEAIVEAFPSWQKPGKQPDPETLQATVQVLGHTAQYFAKALDRPELWEQLTGPRASRCCA